MLLGIAFGTSSQSRLRLFSLRIRQTPVYWESPGGPAPGREPREGCLTKRLFPSGNPQLLSLQEGFPATLAATRQGRDFTVATIRAIWFLSLELDLKLLLDG